MKKLLGILVLGLLWCNAGFSSKVLYYGNYKKNPNKNEYIEHLKSVESGMSWMQIVYNDKGFDSIYCPPEKINLSIDNITEALKLSVKEFKSRNFSNKEIDEFTVEVMLLIGLPILFPCN